MRLTYHHVQPAGIRAMLGLERAVHDGPLEAPPFELIKMRASQLTGCARSSRCTPKTPGRAG
jgi:hypothetical protein